MRKFNSLMLTAFVSVIMLIAANNVYAGANSGLPAELKTTGPAIVGVITIAESDDPYRPVMGFSGECKGEYVDLDPQKISIAFQLPGQDPFTFSDFLGNVDLLEGWVLFVDQDELSICNPEANQVIINTINQSDITISGEIKAKAIILPIVSKDK